MKQDNVVFQVQLLVMEGVAKFTNDEGKPWHTLPCGLKEILPKHGWVAIEPTFFGVVDDGDDATDDEEGSVFFGTPAERQAASARQTPAERAIAVEKRSVELESHQTPIDRVMTSYGSHQFETVRRLQEGGAVVRLRVVSFRFDEVLRQTDSDRGVQIHSRQPAHRPDYSIG